MGRILIVDDDPLVSDSISEVLWDHETVALGDPLEALERLGHGEVFDLVICDIGLPGMDGMDLYAIVCRHIPALSGRFLFITGSVTPRVRDFARMHGRRVLQKPFDVDGLRRWIAGFTDVRKTG